MGVVVKGVLAVILIGVMIVGAIGIGIATGTLQEPSVEGVTNEWGAISDETTEIDSTVVVTNPNPIGIELGSVEIEYLVMMNDIEMAMGSKEGISLEQGTNSLEATTELDNTKIPDWWASHVNNGEETQVTIDPEVHANLILTSTTLDVPEQQRTIETDLIGSLDSNEDQEFSAFGQTLLIIKETRGDWGEASSDLTPLDAVIVVENPNPIPVVFVEIGYEISMNGIIVADGKTNDPITIGPAATETIETTAEIDSSRFDEWWVSHLKNDERTELQVDFYGVVEVQGEQQRIPFDFYSFSDTFETNILGDA